MTGTPAEIEGSAFSSTTVREAAYARIREEIAASEEVTRSWRQRHNDLSLISRLPPELLATIFKCTIEASEWEHDRRYRWFRVTHVCSQWRHVALECPTLWTDIPFRYPRWAEEMLARSKMAPLTIAVAFGEYIGHGYVGSRNAPAVKTALARFSRIKKLSLTQGEWEGYDGHGSFTELIGLLNSPAPLLETFKISCKSRYGGQNRLPDNLFSGDAPRLSHLHISRCGLNWRSPIFANLRSLTVNDIPEVIRPPADQFISALSNMPRLQTLEFHTDFVSTSGVVTPTTTADLSQLVRLSVSSHISNCALLLDHITYPNAARVSATCNMDGFKEDPKTNLSLVQRLADIIGRKVEGPIRSLAVYQQGIKFWTSPGIIPSLYPAVPPQLEFRFLPLQMANNFITEITTKILRPLSLRHLELLLVENVALNETAWLKHFGSLSRLKTLEVGSDYTGFLYALASGTSAALKQSDHAGGPKFKALCKLTIHDWTLDEVHRTGMSDVTCIASLIDCLKARRQDGVALPELVVEDCRHVGEDSVADLEEIVAKVVWDGEENFTEEEEEEDSESAGYYSDDYPPFAYWY